MMIGSRLRAAARRVIVANAVLKSFKDLLNLGNGRGQKVVLEAICPKNVAWQGPKSVARSDLSKKCCLTNSSTKHCMIVRQPQQGQSHEIEEIAVSYDFLVRACGSCQR